MAKKYWTFKGQRLPVKKLSVTAKISNNTKFNNVIRLTGRVNKRINEINIKFGKESWSTGQLLSRLNVKGLDVVRGGKIKIPKNLSEKQLEIVENSLKKFLGQKTSSVRGILDTIRKQKKNIKTSMSDEDYELSDKEVETLYKFFNDKDFQRISDYIPPSDLWSLLQDAKEKGYNEEKFLSSISKYLELGNDVDMVNSLSSIYNKYVSV
jgi:hypothetical protein